ncbi:hypothetical protein GH714_016733 [Hevea brasiliensis]|uniref:Retrotransposon gag domain-containing protein n=1 Tax=Hevea brasiliensis TaxID=3981 RepID=A0A6A6LEU5_HEVBR|nr:hypothetical protein GH714_016733 [Hevea brasiliensis]
MPNTRMDSRVDAIERSLGALEEGMMRMAGEREQNERKCNQVPLVVTDDSQVIAKKVELPNFDGQDPVGWLARADQYFSAHRTSVETKVPLALVCMVGAALHWVRWLKQRSPNMTWEQLSVELLQRFGGDAFASPYERLAVRQEGSVDDFIDEFVARAAQVPGITDKFYIGFFLNGLKAEIRVRIRSQDTGDIFRLMTLAQEVERELLHTGMTKTVSEKSPDAGERWSYGSGPSYKAGGMGFSKQVQQQFKAQTDWVGANKEKVQSKVGNIAQKEIQRLPAPPLTQNKSQQQFSNKSRGTRHLSHQEFEELRTKGLCYCCKQPYHPMHVCPKKTLRVIIVGDDEEASEEGEPEGGETNQSPMVITEVEEGQFTQLELPLFSVGGISRPKTMKIRGRLKGHELTVMVDSGASHNFIANNLVTQLGLPVQSTPTFGVKLGDGHRSESHGDSSLTRALASVSSIEKLDDVEYYTLLWKASPEMRLTLTDANLEREKQDQLRVLLEQF